MEGHIDTEHLKCDLCNTRLPEDKMEDHLDEKHKV